MHTYYAPGALTRASAGFDGTRGLCVAIHAGQHQRMHEKEAGHSFRCPFYRPECSPGGAAEQPDWGGSWQCKGVGRATRMGRQLTTNARGWVRREWVHGHCPAITDKELMGKPGLPSCPWWLGDAHSVNDNDNVSFFEILPRAFLV